MTEAFTAAVSGTNNPPQAVQWTVEGAGVFSKTSITAGGVLSVAADETAPALTVRATSTFNGAVSGTATVSIAGDPSNKAGINGLEIGLAGSVSGEGWHWDADNKTLTLTGGPSLGDIDIVTDDDVTIAVTGDYVTAYSIVSTGTGKLTITSGSGKTLTLISDARPAVSAIGDIEINSGVVYAFTTAKDKSAIESLNGSVTVSGTADVTAETANGVGSAISAAEDINISTSRYYRGGHVNATADAGYSLNAAAVNITNGNTELFFNDGDGTGGAFSVPNPAFSGNDTEVYVNGEQIYPETNTTTAENDNPGDSGDPGGSDGGCNAAPGLLIVLSALPLFFIKRKR